MANNKICILCGKSYSYCPTCSADYDKPVWMKEYCSENCRKLFHAATDYRAKEITKDEAKKIVNEADLSNMQNFTDGIKTFINEIQAISNNTFENSIKTSNIVKEPIKFSEDIVANTKAVLIKENKDNIENAKPEHKLGKGFKKNNDNY